MGNLSGRKKLIIHYNDSTDSDNLAAALAQKLATSGDEDTCVWFILDPRQVLITSDVTPEERSASQELLKRIHGISNEDATRKLLNSPTSDHTEIISQGDRELLQKIKRPECGPVADAEMHGKLAAYDLGRALAYNSPADRKRIEIYIDYESLKTSRNPVNLKFHKHEELFSRSEAELAEYEEISMKNEDLEQAHRRWYARCISGAISALEGTRVSVSALQFDALCQEIRDADSVKFFGGASLGILQRLVQRGVAEKINCCIQAGTFDLSNNMFSDQFNIALNRDAAAFVFENHKEFGDLVIVPSHSAQSTEYSQTGLLELGGRRLEKVILAFNCGENSREIEQQHFSLGTKYPGKSFPMPDLTAYLCSVGPNILGAETKYVKARNLKNDKEPILFEFSDSESDIKVYHLRKRTEPYDISALVKTWRSKT